MTTAQTLTSTSILALMAAVDGLAIDEMILAAIRDGAVIAFSLSGGKDSTTAAHVASAILDLLGHPKHLHEAARAGFRPGRTQHGLSEDLWAWWPGLGLGGILSPAWQRVTITAAFGVILHAKTTTHVEAAAWEALTFLRYKLNVWGDQAIWLDLS